MSTLRRFRPYPAYKDSGVEWLGEIPVGWEALKLKRVCAFLYGESLTSDARTDGEIQVYGSNGPVGMHDRANTLAPCLVIGRKGSFGKVNYSADPVFAIDTTFFVDHRATHADHRWLYYALTDARLDAATKDSAIPGLDREDAYARDVSSPPEPEQHAIAAFLDRETARIDGLVAKKERLIELLQEKRTALITRAVTKGLDSNAPMKDSGVEWLGEIPAHWGLKRLKFVAHIEAGQSPPSEVVTDGSDGLPFLQGNADFGPISPVPRQVCDAAPKRARAGNMLLSVRAPVGALNVADQEYGIGRGLCAIGLSAVVQQRFGFYTLSTTRKQLDRAATGSTYDAVTASHVGDLPQVLPPEPEQRAIAAFLDRETAKLDALVAKVRDAIDRLREYRTALVSAAVTGKIDVREEAP